MILQQREQNDEPVQNCRYGVGSYVARLTVYALPADDFVPSNLDNRSSPHLCLAFIILFTRLRCMPAAAAAAAVGNGNIRRQYRYAVTPINKFAAALTSLSSQCYSQYTPELLQYIGKHRLHHSSLTTFDIIRLYST